MEVPVQGVSWGGRGQMGSGQDILMLGAGLDLKSTGEGITCYLPLSLSQGGIPLGVYMKKA